VNESIYTMMIRYGKDKKSSKYKYMDRDLLQLLVPRRAIMCLNVC
jgi:hypothetical protein